MNKQVLRGQRDLQIGSKLSILRRKDTLILITFYNMYNCLNEPCILELCYDGLGRDQSDTLKHKRKKRHQNLINERGTQGASSEKGVLIQLTAKKTEIIYVGLCPILYINIKTCVHSLFWSILVEFLKGRRLNICTFQC